MLARILEAAKMFSDGCLKRSACLPWFRGHACDEWHLKSTLHRHIEGVLGTIDFTVPPEQVRKVLRDEYHKNYRVFQQAAWPLLKSEERTEWGLVVTMQHYGIPTRMLDWTESFASALYFAHKDRSSVKPAAIWALDPQGLNEIAIKRCSMVALDESSGEVNFDTRPWHPRYVPREQDRSMSENLRTIAVAPPYTNARMTAQRAAFTMMGDSFLALDQQFEGRLVQEGVLMKIALGPDTYDETGEFLRLMGITEFTFFPDLDGLGRRIKAEVEAEIGDAKRLLPDSFKSI